MAKKAAAAPKETVTAPAPKAKKKLVLSSAVHIAGVITEKGVIHRAGGSHYPAGTEVTPAMVAAWEANMKAIGGETHIEAFCK